MAKTQVLAETDSSASIHHDDEHDEHDEEGEESVEAVAARAEVSGESEDESEDASLLQTSGGGDALSSAQAFAASQPAAKSNPAKCCHKCIRKDIEGTSTLPALPLCIVLILTTPQSLFVVVMVCRHRLARLCTARETASSPSPLVEVEEDADRKSRAPHRLAFLFFCIPAEMFYKHCFGLGFKIRSLVVLALGSARFLRCFFCSQNLAV